MFTVTAFVRALRRQWQDEEFRAITSFAAGLILAGTVVYMLVEHWPPLDAPYSCIVTLATGGYGDLSPKTDVGKGSVWASWSLAPPSS
jgi:hypothetical protein